MTGIALIYVHVDEDINVGIGTSIETKIDFRLTVSKLH